MRETEPPPPRRLFLAGLLAAVAAGGAAGLATFAGVGAPDAETFRFARGTGIAPGEETRLRGFLARALDDDRIAVRIVGHTGTQGDVSANLVLSQARADRVAEIAAEMGVAEDQINATGVGGGDALARPADVSERAHEASLSRVDVILQVRR